MTLRRSPVTNRGSGDWHRSSRIVPSRFFPAVAVVEVEARRQFVAAHRSQRVLVHRQHARAEFRTPQMGVQKSRMAVRLQHERRQQEDQVARGHHEVVNDPQRPGIDEVYLDQPSAPVDAVKQQRRARPGYETDVPECAIRLRLRMGRERQAGGIRVPDHELAGREGCRVDLQRGSAFPQRHQASRMGKHGGVRRIHVVGTRERSGARRPEGRHDTLARLCLAPPLGRVEDARAVGRAAVREGECLDHPVAVEPVAVAVAEALVLGRAVPPEGTGEAGREAPVQRRQRSGERLGSRGREAEQSGIPGERAREVLPGSGEGTRRHQDRQAGQRAQGRAAREFRAHRQDPG